MKLAMLIQSSFVSNESDSGSAPMPPCLGSIVSLVANIIGGSPAFSCFSSDLGTTSTLGTPSMMGALVERRTAECRAATDDGWPLMRR